MAERATQAERAARGVASVVMVSYETRDMTCAAIESLERNAGDRIREIVVVDNASTDGSASTIASRFPHVTVVRSDENVGFARAVNAGVRRVSGEYLLLVNPDTVVHDDVVARLVDLAERRPGAGIWGGVAVDGDGVPNSTSALGLPTLWSYLCFGSGLTAAFPTSRLLNPERVRVDAASPDEAVEVGVVTGCLLLVQRALWEELGGFDERYFMYGEDVDLSIRARHLGYRPVISPRITITHYSGAASKQRADKRVLVLKGKATLAREHLGVFRARLAITSLVAGVALRALIHGALRVVSPAASDGSWRAALRRRTDWLPGYDVGVASGAAHGRRAVGASTG
jgi:hypothetical protein